MKNRDALLGFVSAILGGIFSQWVFFGFPHTAPGWLFFVSMTIAVAAAYALFISRKK